MELKDIFSTVHDDFYGNIVGSVVNTIKTTIAPRPEAFIADWSMPATARPWLYGLIIAKAVAANKI